MAEHKGLNAENMLANSEERLSSETPTVATIEYFCGLLANLAIDRQQSYINFLRRSTSTY